MTTPEARAGIYGRQSSGKARSIKEQLHECSDDAAEQRWTITDRWQDTVSASRFTSKIRDEWPLVLAAIEAGQLDVLVLWESSRGDRNAEQWLGFLRLCRERGVLIRVTANQRTYDLSVPSDWKDLAYGGVDSEYESARLSQRVNRAMRENAKNGQVHGACPYGYRREHEYGTDPETGKRRLLVTQLIDDETAPIVREIFTRVGNADPISAITDDLNARGVPAPKGGQWQRSRVRDIALNPQYIGKRSHFGQLTGGAWPAIVDQAKFDTAQRVLTDPTRKTTRPGRNRHLLSHVARCATCGELLIATTKRKGTVTVHYTCDAGHVSIKAEWLDRHVVDLIIERLTRDDIYPSLVKSDDSAVLAARGEAVTLRARLDEHYGQAADGKLSAGGLAAVEARLLPAIEAAEKRAVATATPPVLRELLSAAAGDTRGYWERLSVAGRKDVCRTLFAAIKVLPTPHGRRDPYLDERDHVDGRVAIEWKGH